MYESDIDPLPPAHPQLGTWLQPKHLPDWESKQLTFGSQAGTQSTEPHQPGQNFFK